MGLDLKTIFLGAPYAPPPVWMDHTLLNKEYFSFFGHGLLHTPLFLNALSLK
jgi:hypothetical protein